MITFDNAIIVIFGLDPASHTFTRSVAEYRETLGVGMQEIAFRRRVLPTNVWKLQKWLQIGAERKCTLYEAFRLYSPVPFNHKTAAKADTFPSGHNLKRRNRVLVSHYSMGRMEETWGKDCLEFKPEKWIDLKRGGLVYVPSQKYVSFGTGARTRLGKDMAFIQMKVVAIAILRIYRLQVVDEHIYYLPIFNHQS
ncbi:hypothetical protein TIFTF001_011813 [Ficus carica]|uniref:Uncharacterized protein n=1 Tax=Ficus carica TaxID=3494 RepID=A0AA87ZZC6_FICCA|nr:hypothetical protein TIFTF001_011813 [Ficus carica]